MRATSIRLRNKESTVFGPDLGSNEVQWSSEEQDCECEHHDFGADQPIATRSVGVNAYGNAYDLLKAEFSPNLLVVDSRRVKLLAGGTAERWRSKPACIQKENDASTSSQPPLDNPSR